MSQCRQKLKAEGKPYPRSGCEICGQWSPRWKECEANFAVNQTPPQPIYDEAKERELFEAVFPPCAVTFWREEDCKYYSDLWLDEGGQEYQRKWEGWLACAQSRAKAGEDE